MNVKSIFEKMRKNGYANITWKTENGNYLKVSQGVVRYWCVSECKNGNIIVRLRTTKNKNLKIKTSYFLNGIEITETEYLSGGNPKHTIEDWFSKNINDIVKVG